MNVEGKHVLVVGLARSGLAVAQVLARHGAVVTVTDRKPPAEFRDVLPKLLKDKVGLELGMQREETFLHHQAIVISPGVPWDLPELQAARRRGIPVYPEVEVASWYLKGTLVGVTGSNGKTTTTALLGRMLEGSGFPTFVGGNIGNALSSAVGHAGPGTKFVTELSSFQLEGIHEFRPHVAVMLNLSPNHLDRHPTLEAYAQAKRQIFRNQQGQDYAVLNADDPWVAGLQEEVHSRAILFSRQRELTNGVFVSGGRIYYRVGHLERFLYETRDVNLRGDFNLEDVLAATTAACVLGADFAAIRKAVREFKAVEHRLEFVQEIQGVDFYNNSKATSVDATVKSLQAFERGVHLIMGGKDKGAPYSPLLPVIKDRVRDILLIGAAAPVITAHLSGSTELVQAGDLATAVREAFMRSRPGDTVLLAPACSSFDQFKDYEVRGRVFKDLVKLLAEDVAAGRVIRPKLPVVAAPEPPPKKSEVGRQESGVRREETGARGPESGVRGSGPGILNLESGILPARPGALRPAASVPKAAPEAAPIAVPKPPRPPAPAPKAGPEAVPTAAPKPSRPTAPVPAVKDKVWHDLSESLASALPPPPAPVVKVAEAPETAPVEPPAHTSAPEQKASVPAPPDRIEAAPETERKEKEIVPPPPQRDEKVSVPELEAKDGIAFAPDDEEKVAEPAPGEKGSPASALDDNKVSEAVPEEKGSASSEPQHADRIFEAEPEESAPAAPRHIELTYVYEVDAVELPATESQVVPEDEPSIAISTGPLEAGDDEVLPFEARAKEPEVALKESGDRSQETGKATASEVRGPKSEIASKESGDKSQETGTATASEVRGPKSDVRRPISKGQSTKAGTRSPRSEVQSIKTEVRIPDSEADGTKPEDRSATSEAQTSQSEGKGPKSDAQNAEAANQEIKSEAPGAQQQPPLFKGSDK
jgi:UDP-N-acetylmuramoylalanine--D-glutamate ligase